MQICPQTQLFVGARLLCVQVLNFLWVRDASAIRTAKSLSSKPQFCGFAARSHVKGCIWLGVGSNQTSFKLVRFWVSYAVMSFKAIICWVLTLNPLTRCPKLAFLSNIRPQTHTFSNFAAWALPQTHTFSNFAARPFLKVLPQTHTFSNFAASTFFCLSKISRKWSSRTRKFVS